MRSAKWRSIGWLQFVGVYLAVSMAAHFVWEILQLPLYTIWTTGTRQQLTFAVFHCTIGDVIIAGLTLLTALVLFGRRTWPGFVTARVYAANLLLGLCYTIFSEWLNTSVRGSWAYSDLMPIVPFLGTGLAPLLQWIVVPTVAMWLSVGRPPWSNYAPIPQPFVDRNQ